MRKRRFSSERGQTLIIVALAFLAFVAILALALDGGNVYAARRQAQNAADSGALAGATYMCEYYSEAGGTAKAIEYAVLNGAENPPIVNASLATNSVEVTATVQIDAFFAGIIGYPQFSPSAFARAECRPPTGLGVMPVAWSCRERVFEGEPLPGVDCAQEFGPDNIYILMDSVKVKTRGRPCDPDQTDPTHPDYCYEQNDLLCAPPPGDDLPAGTIDCDLDNDGINELMAGGARSWLDLNGAPAGGASELSNWILNGFPDIIFPHTWLSEQSGVATSIYKDATVMVGKDVILPVFNKICDAYPDIYANPEGTSACTYGDPDDRTKASPNMNFHIISFSKFYVTCVQTAKNKAVDEIGSSNGCPGHDLAVSNDSIDDNDKTIEGYFKDEQIFGYGGEGDWVDVGTFVVVLVR